MKWLDMANMLFEKSNILSPRGAHLHLDTAGWIRTWTPHQNAVADSAARFFSRNLSWPTTDPDPSCQLYFRCLLAIEKCIQFDSQGTPPPGSFEEERKSLEHLLVECWHRDGLEWAQGRYPTQASKPRWAFA